MIIDQTAGMHKFNLLLVIKKTSTKFNLPCEINSLNTDHTLAVSSANRKAIFQTEVQNRKHKKYNVLSRMLVLFILDIDECSLSTVNCRANAKCSNTDGSYRCTCNSGYDGYYCRGKLISLIY